MRTPGSFVPVILQIPDSAIADAAEAVFSAAEYARGRPSLLGRAFRWLRGLFAPLGEAAQGSPPLFWWVVGAGALLVLLVVGRFAYLAHLRRTLHASDRSDRQAGSSRGRARDPWIAAEALAAEGQFTAAAHALYRALLEGVARRERLRLHPAMTVGDYTRVLRSRSSALFTRFREFARSYETVVYGVGTCDRERYERLRELALPLVKADG